ncbi:hypothetical protein BTO20_00530 [Mycobacterium dioxanotrophicus]|uniref:Uncharacterized protein n=1 Tax=Mycobacterium dioxanotrophicus TaxID=482462 RepID=A0A1Y0BWL7_9MYCO|nr:hypothetical protein BTO20_00530 [Mycobacterium dioxanotrophicus]
MCGKSLAPDWAGLLLDPLHLADQSFLPTVPAFGPAIVVAAVVMFGAMRDRRKRDGRTLTGHADSPGHDGRNRDSA